jgi:uncharacterized protein YfiM (DUF2279 family)
MQGEPAVEKHTSSPHPSSDACQTQRADRPPETRGGWVLFLRYWLPVLACAALIFTLSSGPAPAFVGMFTNEDKLLHFGEYGTFGLLLSRAVLGTSQGGDLARGYLFSVCLGFLMGASDELYQSSVPGRSSSLSDLAVDLLGVALAGCAMYLFYRRARRAAMMPRP